MLPRTERPRIDAHAHIAPSVTRQQVHDLGNAFVFGMTRSLDEARQVVRRVDTNVLWGVGTHPAVAESRDAYRPEAFRKALEYFAVVGEVGLDRRGPREQQRTILDSVLDECHDAPVLISLHSTGRTSELLEALERRPHPGAILHWFTGGPTDLRRALDLGCYFSVNGAMPPETVSAIPADRLLTETDFPSSRRKIGARLPGDTTKAEELIAASHPGSQPRALIHDNLRRILSVTGALDRLNAQQAALLYPVETEPLLPPVSDGSRNDHQN
ncbi:TatD family hydrolase [Terrabacter sp. Root85]|uniref:TatD family hydrolase n=1 Tax=Terrabacter sp. Root85 TaxID=1736603 RepID=UPI000AE5B057|nr:TatD family hydrolase [Terrabacter sp. Root85]